MAERAADEPEVGPCGPGNRTLPKSVQKLAALLREAHRAAACFVTLTGSRDSSYKVETVSIDKVYVPPRLVPMEDLCDDRDREQVLLGGEDGARPMQPLASVAADSTQSIEMEDVLEFGSRPLDEKEQSASTSARLLVLASGGNGKSMVFLRNAPIEWSGGRLWKEVDLLFALPLCRRTVHQAGSALELLGVEALGIVSSEELEAIRDYLSAHWNRVCIILDGVDEIGVSGCSGFVQDVLSGRSLRQAHVIVTSRPSNDILKLKLEREFCFTRQLELVGFSHENVSQYLENVLLDEDAQQIKRQMTQSPLLAAFMQTPINCAYACSLFRSGTKHWELPTNRSAVLAAMVQVFAKQQEEKTLNPLGVTEDWCKGLTMELGAFAFRTLMSKVTVFRERDFELHRLSQEAKSLGLFMACDAPRYDTSPSWRFSHHMMQEGLAARFTSNVLKTSEDVEWLVYSFGPTTGHLDTFWMCLAAELPEEDMKVLITALLSLRRTSHSGRLSAGFASETVDWNTLCCQPASDDVYLFSCSPLQIDQLADRLSQYITIDQSERLADRLLYPVVSSTGRGYLYVRAKMRQDIVFTNLELMQVLLRCWQYLYPQASLNRLYQTVASFDETSAAACFPAFVDQQPSSEAHPVDSLKPPKWSAEYAQQMLLVAGCYDAYCTGKGEDCTPEVPALMNELQSVGLVLSKTHLTAADCSALGKVLASCGGKVKKLSIYHCHFGDGGYQRLAKGLEACKSLCSINLERNNLTDTHSQHMGKVVEQNTRTLKSLRVTDNNFSSQGLAKLLPAASKCSGLQSVAIGGAKANQCDLNHRQIARVLDRCKRLDKVILWNFLLSPRGHARVFPLLEKMKLKSLSLENTGLTMSTLDRVNCLLRGQQECLVCLDLSANRLEDDFLLRVHRAIGGCKKLEALYLANTELTSRSLPILADIMSELPCLKVLVFPHNYLTENHGIEAFKRVIITQCDRLEIPLKLELPLPSLLHPDLFSMLQELNHAMLQLKYLNAQYEQWQPNAIDE